MWLWYHLIFANFDTYQFTFCEMTSNLYYFNTIQQDSAAAYCAGETVNQLCKEKKTLFCWTLSSKQPDSQPSWLSDMKDHLGKCLPYKHPERWWTEMAADSDLVQSWPWHYRNSYWPMVLKTWSMHSCKWLVHFKHTVWTHLQWPYMTCSVSLPSSIIPYLIGTLPLANCVRNADIYCTDFVR